MSVAAFVEQLFDILREADVNVSINPKPQEVPNPIPFDQDVQPRPYDPTLVNTWWRITSAVEPEKGSAPGMKVKLISSGEPTKQYAVIFSTGDEAYSGLMDFAEKYHVTSGHFTAIGALSSVVLAWFDPQKKMYCENSFNEHLEVAAMIGDFAVYQGKPALHTHMVVGHRDGSASGGHVIEAIVSPTLEVFVTIDPVSLQKKFDPATDLTLIDPSEK